MPSRSTTSQPSIFTSALLQETSNTSLYFSAVTEALLQQVSEE